MRFHFCKPFAVFSGWMALTVFSAWLSVLAQTAPSGATPGVLAPGDTSGYPSLGQPYSMPTPSEKRGEPEPSGVQVGPADVPLNVSGDVFQFTRIDVEGNEILPDSQLRTLIAPYEGRTLNTADLGALVGKINEAYRVKGYLTSLAFVPPQDLERGVLTIKVLEGMIGEMEVSGNRYFKAKAIASRISEKPGQPLNVPMLERELLRINRTEPFQIKASLMPGNRTGETRVRFDVKEQQPFQIALTSDNAGRPGIGTYRQGIELLDRNVTGHGDRFGARYLVASGHQLASAAYTLPVGRYGTEVSGLFGFSHVNVDLASLGIRNQPELIGNTYSYGLLLSQPLDRERNWTADLGFNARRASSFFDGHKTNTTDIRSLALGLNYDHYDRYGRTFARAQTTFAPQWLGANTHFFKLENHLTRVTRLPKNNLLILRGYSQWSPDPLPPIEQFQLGGVNSVRGYTQGLLFGDRGYNVGLEWRWPIPMLSRVSPWMGERVQGALFVDYGQVWMDKGNRFYIAGLSNSRQRTSLLGAGIGVRAHLTDYLQGYADMGFGLLDRRDVEPNAQPTMRVHFGVRSELLSNDYKTRSNRVTQIKTPPPPPTTHAAGLRSGSSVGMLPPSEPEAEVSDPTLEPVDALKPRIR